MDVQVEKTGSYSHKLSISIPAGDVDAAYAVAYRKVSKQAQMPGFRAGKVPRSLIERNYGSQMESEVKNELVEGTLFKAMDNHQIVPVAMPRLQLGDLHKGAAFSYTAEVEVRPEIELKTYEGLPAPALDNTVEPSDVDAEIETMRKQAAQTVPVMLRDDVQDGDVVQLDYEGSIDGVPFQGGAAQNAMVEVGAGGYIPGFAEGLVGARVPGERDVAVTFPEDYSAKQLAGKAAVFKMTLKELKTRELPKLDDEFAKDMGEDSLDALRTKISEGIKGRKQSEAEGNRRRALLEALIAANPFEVPPSMIDSQTDRIVAGAAARVERMVGQKLQLSHEQLHELRDSSRKDAEFQVRSALLLMEVGKKLGTEITPEEIETEIEKQVELAGEHAEAVRSMFDDAERREEMRFRLLEDKVVAHMLERSTVAPAGA